MRCLLLDEKTMWAMGFEGRERTMDPWTKGRRNVVSGGRRMTEASLYDVRLVWAEWGATSGEGKVSWHEQRRRLRWYQTARRQRHGVGLHETSGYYHHRHCGGRPGGGGCTLLYSGTMPSMLKKTDTEKPLGEAWCWERRQRTTASCPLQFSSELQASIGGVHDESLRPLPSALFYSRRCDQCRCRRSRRSCCDEDTHLHVAHTVADVVDWTCWYCRWIVTVSGVVASGE